MHGGAYSWKMVVSTPRLKRESRRLAWAFGKGSLFGLFLFAFNFDPDCIHTLNSNWILWPSAFGMALFPTAFSLICTSAAIQKIGSTPVAILGAVEPVTAVAIAVLLFNETMTVRLAIGMALVIFAVTLIISGGKLSQPLLRVRKMFPRIRKGRG